jgi:hypothetical protein
MYKAKLIFWHEGIFDKVCEKVFNEEQLGQMFQSIDKSQYKQAFQERINKLSVQEACQLFELDFDDAIEETTIQSEADVTRIGAKLINIDSKDDVDVDNVEKSSEDEKVSATKSENDVIECVEEFVGAACDLDKLWTELEENEKDELTKILGEEYPFSDDFSSILSDMQTWEKEVKRKIKMEEVVSDLKQRIPEELRDSIDILAEE